MDKDLKFIMIILGGILLSIITIAGTFYISDVMDHKFQLDCIAAGGQVQTNSFTGALICVPLS